MKVRILVVCAALALGSGAVMGCGQDSSTEGAAQKVEDAGKAAGQAVEDTGKKLGDNVDNAGQVLEQGYEDAREKGENQLEAAGDAYNELLDVPREEKAE